MANPWKPRTLLFLAATTAYLVVMCVGTHLPGSVVHSSGHTDKLYHFGAFLGLAVLLCFSLRCFCRLGIWQYAAIVGGIACYGVVDELTQTLSINRSADPLDWLADVSGAILGVVAFAVLARVVASRENRQGATG